MVKITVQSTHYFFLDVTTSTHGLVLSQFVSSGHNEKDLDLNPQLDRDKTGLSLFTL